MTAQPIPNTQELSLDRDFLMSLFECLQEGVFAAANGQFVMVNSALCDLLGYSRDELMNITFLDVVAEEDRELVFQRAKARLKGESPPDRYDIGLVCKDGFRLSVQIKVSTFSMPSGFIVNVGSVRNITEEKIILSKLQRSEREFRRIIENLPDIFYRTDAQGIVTLASPYSAEVMGYQIDEVMGKPLADFYAHKKEREAVLQQILAGRGETVAVESCLRHRDGSLIWVATHAFANFSEDGEFLGVEGVARNITERKNLEERLRYMAIRDPLTQVFNRFGFEECLSATISRARRNSMNVALLFFDLDKFKSINDNHGHDVGDQYLYAFAKRLEIGFREIDTVARLGGDEFVVLLENIEKDVDIYSLLERCITALSDPFVNEELSLPFLYSYGIAQYPKNGSDIESLLKHADEAMYSDKKGK